MKHTEYVEFFRDIARTHPDLLHSDSAMHFGRLVITRDPLMGSQHQINEFLHNNGSKLKYPCLLLVAFRGDYADNRSDNKRKRMDGSFILLDKVREGDHDGEEDVYNRMETLGEEIASICIDHFDDNPEQGIFDVNVMENEKIAKVANDKFGVKFYFGIDKSADALLSEPLPQEKINGIADQATYRNSTGSFIKAIAAGGEFVAADVIHTDSSGEKVPTPANVAFVASPIFGFAGSVLADDNTSIELYLTRPAYATALATGAMEIADLNFVFNQNGGEATDATISSIEKIDEAVVNEAGDIAIRLNLSITGMPSGVETITINPVADSMFNVEGVAMPTAETINITLNQTYTNTETSTYIDRVVADGGEVINADKVDSVYTIIKSHGFSADALSILSADFGIKKDASNKITKLYSLYGHDLEQLTSGEQLTWEQNADTRNYLLSDGTQYMGKDTTEGATAITAIQTMLTDMSAATNVLSLTKGAANDRYFAGYNDTNQIKVHAVDTAGNAYFNDFTTPDAEYHKSAITISGSTFNGYKNTITNKLTTTMASTVGLTNIFIGLHSQKNAFGLRKYKGRIKDGFYFKSATSEAFVSEILNII